MPHIDDRGIKIPRVTEIINALNCELNAYFNSNMQKELLIDVYNNLPILTEDEVHELEKNTTSNYSSLRGTIVHLFIERHYAYEKTNVSDNEYLLEKLSKADSRLYNKIMKDDPEQFERLMNNVNFCINNFKSFVTDHKINPLFQEETLIYNHIESGVFIPKKSMKGTIDFIGYITDVNTLLRLGLDETPSTIIIDWKSGNMPQKTYQAQLQAYLYLLEKTEKWKLYNQQGLIKYPISTRNGIPVAMCVMLGGKKYQAQIYELDMHLFNEAYKIFLNSKKKVYNHLTFKHDSEGFHCIYCPFNGNGCTILNTK
jgi:CRISPR/Cas system-associated exonuclease Cas4 (RecB family)